MQKKAWGRIYAPGLQHGAERAELRRYDQDAVRVRTQQKGSRHTANAGVKMLRAYWEWGSHLELLSVELCGAAAEPQRTFWARCSQSAPRGA